MEKSFHIIGPIDLNDIRGETELPRKLSTPQKSPIDKEQGEDKDTRPSTPQNKGIKLHGELTEEINKKDSRKDEDQSADEDSVDKMILKMLERKFNCEFIQAGVSISGYAVRKSNFKEDYYSGIMDAVAMRPRSPEDDPNFDVFVVDWKTTSKGDVANLANWWKRATTFKEPLYQCLIYRELLQMHLIINNITARVGIMLVPFHQSLGHLMPGLCMDVQKMNKEDLDLLDNLNDYEWFPDKASLPRRMHTVKLPCKLFNEKVLDPNYVDESNNVLKQDVRLKDIISDEATIEDLRNEFDLFEVKVEATTMQERIRIATDDKTKDEYSALGAKNEVLVTEEEEEEDDDDDDDDDESE